MYHFIGIKGSGMSALAIIMKKLGLNVQGSDNKKHYFTEEGLIKNNIKILEFNKENIKSNMIIIKGNTYNEENEEVKQAKKYNLKIYTYQEMINKIAKSFNLITVSGCHGKTTTSSMLAHILNSNYIIGDGSGDIGTNNYFVLEACEYKRHFLNYNPNYAIITNIDLDHIDYYKNIKDMVKAYQQFISNATTVIAFGDDKNIKKLKHRNIYTYGLKKDNYFKAKKIKYKQNGISFNLYIDNKYKYHFKLPFYGKHMLENTLAVIGICYLEKIELKEINKKLKTFKGAKRRFNEQKVKDNVIIDDYAHHPNEIKAVIEATKQKYPKKQLITIFEPHTFSRTKKFYKQIACELNKSDYTYIMDIYPSREKQEDYKKITSNMILKRIKNGEHLDKNEYTNLLKHKNAVLLFMSPNDLKQIEENYKDLYIKQFDKENNK